MLWRCVAEDGGKWRASRHSHVTSRERAPGTHCIKDEMDTRACLDVLKIGNSLSLLRIESRLFYYAAHNQVRILMELAFIVYVCVCYSSGWRYSETLSYQTTGRRWLLHCSSHYVPDTAGIG